MVTSGTGTMSRLMVMAVALLFATGGAAIKATTIGGWQTAGFRSAIAAVALMLFVPEARRGWTWRAWLVGVVYASTLISFVHSTKLTTSANAIFLQATAPAYLLVLGPLLLKERVGRRDLWLTLALACGMALCFMGTQNPLQTAPDPGTGNWFAAFSGLAYALTLAGLRWQAHAGRSESAALATVTAGNMLAFLVCLPKAVPVASVTVGDVLTLLYLGFIQIGLAYWLLTRGMRHVPAFEASTLLLLEPVANPVFTWLAHGEKPGAWALAGGAVIVLSTLWKTRGEPEPVAER